MRSLWRILAGLSVVAGVAYLLLRVPDTDAAQMRAKYGGPPSQFMALPDGPTVHYRDEGPRGAPVIVLLHGSNDDIHTWQGWVDALVDQYRVIRFDQRGHGLTGPALDRRYDTDSFVADVERLVKQLGVDRFVLVGSSMGGGIALRYAMLHPEQLAGLVLVDAAGAPIKREGGGNVAFQIMRVPLLNRLGMAIMPRFVIEKSMRQSVANPASVTPDMVDRIWQLARHPGNRAATLTRFGQGYRTYSAREVAAVRVPALVMWGDADRLVPLAAGEWFARTLPDATFVHYPRVGHLPMQETPERSAADVARFVETVRAAPPA